MLLKEKYKPKKIYKRKQMSEIKTTIIYIYSCVHELQYRFMGRKIYMKN